MPRIARIVAVGHPHHVTQRGNYRQDIFDDDESRAKYLKFVQTESERYGLEILAYCLMSNHVHFIVVPETLGSMGNVFKYVNMKYSQYFNKKFGERGHLFQGRFFSTVMDEAHTMTCVKYIERNPVRAKMVKGPLEWKWSSANGHCGGKTKKQASLRLPRLQALFKYVGIDQKEWQKYLEQEDDAVEMRKIKENTIKGRPLAGVGFIKRLEEKLDRVLILKSRGRPRKKTEKHKK